MKINNGIVALLLLATGFTAGAQHTNTSYAEGAFHEATWFVGGGLGLNVGFDGEKYQSRAESHSGAGMALDAYAGYWLFENLAFRAGIKGISTSDQYTNFGKYKNLYLHGDVLFKVGNGFIPYLHAGYAHINKGSVAGGAGLMFPIHLSRRVAVVPDVSVAALSSRAFNNGTGSVGLSTAATLGVYVSLGAEHKHHDPEHWESIETIGGTVWRLRSGSGEDDLAMVQRPDEKETVKVKTRPERPKKEKAPVERDTKPARTENAGQSRPVEAASGSGINNSADNTLIYQFLPPDVDAYSAQAGSAAAPRTEVNDPVFNPNGHATYRQFPVESTETAPAKKSQQDIAPVQPRVRVVYFDFDLYDISDLAAGMLDDLAAEMKAESDLNILVVGHTDSRGTDEYNLRLSLERAEAVKQYLVEKGISGGRIATQGVGAAQPAASNDNDGGRALNRRAVIINQNK